MQLLTSPLVQALEAPFQELLDGIARARGWPTSTEHACVGARVKRLSDAYNDPTAAPMPSDEHLSARLLFSFPRDVPKGAGAVRELCAAGMLPLRQGRPLRVLDVGAGLGAMTRGVLRALARSGLAGEVRVDAVDSDGDALDVAMAIARARPREGGVSLEMSKVRAEADRASLDGPYDLIVLGQVLSELDRGTPAPERVTAHASLLHAYAAQLGEGGALVIVEPALRERTRHLHAVRDALVGGSRPLHVFAPCLHDDACPALQGGDAWCHEDLDVDLPPWLVPIARAAGLRWQGLTFSYLVLRRDGGRQLLPGAAGSPALRVVSAPLVTKGKRELYLCGRFEPESAAARLNVMRLDRHGTPLNAAWDLATRGAVIRLTPGVAPARPRVLGTTAVAVEVPESPAPIDRPGTRR